MCDGRWNFPSPVFSGSYQDVSGFSTTALKTRLHEVTPLSSWQARHYFLGVQNIGKVSTCDRVSAQEPRNAMMMCACRDPLQNHVLPMPFGPWCKRNSKGLTCFKVLFLVSLFSSTVSYFNNVEQQTPSETIHQGRSRMDAIWDNLVGGGGLLFVPSRQFHLLETWLYTKMLQAKKGSSSLFCCYELVKNRVNNWTERGDNLHLAFMHVATENVILGQQKWATLLCWRNGWFNNVLCSKLVPCLWLLLRTRIHMNTKNTYFAMHCRLVHAL